MEGEPWKETESGKAQGEVPGSMAGRGKNARPGFKSTTEKRPQINCVSAGTAPSGVSALTFCPLNGFWVGWGRGWWYRTHPGPRLCGPCPLLDAGFWKSKFDPSLTRTETFHLDEHFAVPVDMMQAHTYPLHWFSLEQPEIQVTLDGPGRAQVLGGGEGSRQAREQAQGWGGVSLPSL